MRFSSDVIKMEKVSKKKLIEEYKEGDIVVDIFVVKIKKGISSTTNGKYFFSLVLTDSSGKSIDYRYWGGMSQEKVKVIYDLIKNDSVVLIIGKVSSYNEKMQITSDELQILRVLEPTEFDSGSFIKRTKKDIEQLYTQIEGYINSIKEEKLKKELLLILTALLRRLPVVSRPPRGWPVTRFQRRLFRLMVPISHLLTPRASSPWPTRIQR